MAPTDIALIRLYSQQIAATKFKTVKNIVGWMGAMQAQDFAMSKWAIGLRLSGSTEQTIQQAIDKGEIIRTHILRPTWHLISAADIYWMLELTAPQIKILMRSRDKELELSESLYTESHTIIEKVLRNGEHLTREALMSELEKAKIATHNYRSGHFMLRAELDGIVCSGAMKGGKQTYALLQQRVPKINLLSKEEALARLAKSYFSSHGPATLQDFIWWSGLPVREAKSALELVRSAFTSETIDEVTYWFSPSFSATKTQEPSVYLLPAFDEFLISYKNRSASITKENQQKAFTKNGIFQPVIVVNGQVVGLWKRILKNGKAWIETAFFEPLQLQQIKDLVQKKAESLGKFLNKETIITSK